MSKSLEINPLLIPPVLARWLGRCAAVVLQQLHYWSQKSKHIRDGLKWVYNTYAAWAAQIQFFGEPTIKRALQFLASLKLIRVEQIKKHEFDRTNWYAIDYGRLNYLISSIGSERSDRKDQNDPIEKIEMILSSYIDPETPSETSNRDTASAAKAVSEPESEPQPPEPGQNLPPCQGLPEQPKAIGGDTFSAAAPAANFLNELSDLAIELNPATRKAIEENPGAVPAALARVRASLSWAQNRTGLFVKTLQSPQPPSPPTPTQRINFDAIEHACSMAWKMGDRPFIAAKLQQLAQDGFSPEVDRLIGLHPEFAALLSEGGGE